MPTGKKAHTNLHYSSLTFSFEHIHSCVLFHCVFHIPLEALCFRISLKQYDELILLALMLKHYQVLLAAKVGLQKPLLHSQQQ